MNAVAQFNDHLADYAMHGTAAGLIPFARCLPVTMEYEGIPGNDDDPHDPGGRTSRGILQREYNAYCVLHQVKPGDVWSASDASVIDIYFRQYWLPFCPKLWPGLDMMFFDQFVNEGRVQATKDLQRALRVDKVDGWIGMVTLAAIDAVNDRESLLRRYSDVRLGFYRHLRNFPYFGRGWTRRADGVLKVSLQMLAKGS